jgi:hypothetical protein
VVLARRPDSRLPPGGAPSSNTTAAATTDHPPEVVPASGQAPSASQPHSPPITMTHEAVDPPLKPDSLSIILRIIFSR